MPTSGIGHEGPGPGAARRPSWRFKERRALHRTEARSYIRSNWFDFLAETVLVQASLTAHALDSVPTRYERVDAKRASELAPPPRLDDSPPTVASTVLGSRAA